MTKILVIEDEESIRYDILEILEIEAFETDSAVNGLEGVQKAIQYQPDIIICDITMPVLDGYGALEQIRQNPITALIPFIFLSAKAERVSQRRGMNLGADDYLAKPISRVDLLEAIATRLRKKATSDSYHISLANALQSAQEKLDQMAYSDNLTGLLNRLSLRQHLTQVILAASNSQQLVSIFVVDIDRFSRINETFGQMSGDLLLQAVASRLIQSVGTKYNIARVNADEFAIILANTNRDQSSKLMAKQILEQLSQPFDLGDREVYITASIGIALYPEHGTNIDSLLRHVNVAMQAIKERGGNDYGIYDPDANIKLDGQLELETDLYRALDRHELKLHYQPQISLKTGQIIGAEALLRWYHPQHGLISPLKFIPLAEKNGSIILIGEWVIKTACQDLKTWHEVMIKNPNPSGLPHIAVNISGRQFQQSHLAVNIVNILAEIGLDPAYLELELTESTIVQDVDASISKLSYLKSLGIRMSLDDFGTGYSSLSYLRQFPIDTLKIDQSFIRNITTDQKSRAIAIAIIQLAHNMNLKVLAEGVETPEELEILRQNQCDEIQGFVFSKAIPAEEFQKLLLNKR